MNSIQGVVICQNTGQRGQVRNALNRYAGQSGISTDPIALDYDGGKYGIGPAVIIMAWFGDNRTFADECWADLDSANRPFIQPNSYLMQTSDDVVVHHDVWTEQGRTVIV